MVTKERTLEEIQKEKQELLNLKEALLLIKFLTVPNIEHIKHQNRKGKKLTLYHKKTSYNN